MMDCFCRSSIDFARRSPAAFAAAVLALACVACTGCTTGVLFGADDCDCYQQGHDAGCNCGDDSALPVDGAEWHDGWFTSNDGEDFAPVALDESGAGTCDSTCDDGSCGRSRRRWYEPEAGIFNFCVPPGVISPPPPPPPGRFHPVPVRPVFAPQPSLTLAVPHGE